VLLRLVLGGKVLFEYPENMYLDLVVASISSYF